jgi:hypothetical protein
VSEEEVAAHDWAAICPIRVWSSPAANLVQGRRWSDDRPSVDAGIIEVETNGSVVPSAALAR